MCECKDRKNKKASFSDVAKFCRVLDSVKAKFGIIFSANGLSGEGEAENADREILKIYQDRGMVIVVVNRDDSSKREAKGRRTSTLCSGRSTRSYDSTCVSRSGRSKP